jgi:hypothetical protein
MNDTHPITIELDKIELNCNTRHHQEIVCFLLPLKNLLWDKLRDYTISRVNVFRVKSYIHI